MSHSKMTRRGKSHYLNSWNPRAKRFIVSCTLCGHVGFRPEILDPDFASSTERRVIRSELEAVLKPLQLDSVGRCETCASVSGK